VAPRWGFAQAVWLVVQFFAMQVATQIVVVVVLVVARLVAVRLGRHVPALDFHDGMAGLGGLVVLATVAGYLAAAWWSVWYIGRLGGERVRDGGPAGIGWRPAPGGAYVAAVGCLVAVGAASLVVQHVFPPPANEAAKNIIVQIFGGAAWKIGVLFVMAAVLAPFTEELVFRGGMIAALSPRLGAVWAAVATSVVFTMCHMEETWSYHAGMLVILSIAVALAWLRLRYRSIRPGILLHVLFNGFGVLALALGR
jgi:membrane protease YdiL (CAAX protease family)